MGRSEGKGNRMRRAVVTGAGGFIGHHLVTYLVQRGYWVRGVDLKLPEFEPSRAHEFLLLDLRDPANCHRAVEGVDEVYHLAADMGGIGYISRNHAGIARNNLLINIGMLDAARDAGVQRFFFASSACVYPLYRQQDAEVTPLREEDAYPAQPEEGYGWEKLMTEKLCEYYRQEYGLETRIARFHNVFGPLGTFEGGREKAPAALCRKIALAQDGGEIEVWGDGKQTRSFLYIDDCVEGIYRITQSDYPHPLNLGSDRLVTIDELVGIIAAIAGKRIRIRHNVSQPQGVRGRNSDNSRLRAVLGWEPSVPLEEGLRRTYRWIAEQLAARSHAAAAAE